MVSAVVLPLLLRVVMQSTSLPRALFNSYIKLNDSVSLLDELFSS